MMTRNTKLLAWAFVLLSWIPSTAQLGNTPQNNQFYLDSSTDCNGPVRNVYSTRTVIKGQGAIQSGPGPSTCVIALKTEKPYEVANFKIEIGAMNIQDCSVTFSIYDGEPGQNVLDSFDCNKGLEPNMRDLVTTGDKITFVLQRQDIRNTRYDIDIVAVPLVAGRDPGYENGNGGDYGYNYHRKFPTEAIVGIVGGLFMVIVLVIVILSVYCYRKHKGMTQKWAQQPLSHVVAPSTYAESGKNSDSSSVWASEMSRNPDYKSSRSRHRADSEYSESQFDDFNSLPPKRSYAPSSRSVRTDRTTRSQNTLPPSYDRATRPSDSYSGSEEEHVEKEIPVKSRRHRPHTATTSTSVGVDPVPDDDLGDDELIESEPEVEEEEEETEEEQSEEEEEDDNQRRAPTVGNRQTPATIPTPVQTLPPHMHHVDPRLQHQMMPDGSMVPQQYHGYPPQQQFIPVQAVPYQMPPGYPPPGYGLHQGPSHAQPEPVRVPSVKPTEPPIYSYLVQRGYTPLDGRRSPSVASGASHSSTGRLLKEDSDSGNLECGVEFMRR